MKNKNYYALFSYDYGGGYNLLKFSKKLKKDYCKFFFKGPSSKLLKQNNFKKKLTSIDLSNCNRVYYSLSWNKQLENFIYTQKKKFNYKTYLILDGWGDYKKKMFLQKNNKNIPDFVIVLDKFAFNLARKQKLDKISKLVNYNNYLFRSIKNQYLNYKKKKNKYILYLASPLIKNNSINKILKYIKIDNNKKIKVRYHPKMLFKKNTDLLSELRNAEKVYGHYSTSLIYASLLKIKTYSINHTFLDYYKWKKFRVFSNFNINEINIDSFNSSFKKINNSEYI